MIGINIRASSQQYIMITVEFQRAKLGIILSPKILLFHSIQTVQLMTWSPIFHKSYFFLGIGNALHRIRNSMNLPGNTQVILAAFRRVVHKLIDSCYCTSSFPHKTNLKGNIRDHINLAGKHRREWSEVRKWRSWHWKIVIICKMMQNSTKEKLHLAFWCIWHLVLQNTLK